MFLSCPVKTEHTTLPQNQTISIDNILDYSVLPWVYLLRIDPFIFFEKWYPKGIQINFQSSLKNESNHQVSAIMTDTSLHFTSATIDS